MYVCLGAMVVAECHRVVAADNGTHLWGKYVKIFRASSYERPRIASKTLRTLDGEPLWLSLIHI